MKICVFGLWHLGCVTAACLAELGFDVKGLDLDKKNVRRLQSGKAPLYEPRLDDLIKKQLQSGKLSFFSQPSKALDKIDVLWVAFDTPIDENDVADISYIEKNILSMVPLLKNGTKVVISSQIPVGFTKRIKEKIKKAYPAKELYFAYAPENLRLGKSVKIFLEPDRIIIGTLAREKAKFLPLFLDISTKLEWMSVESAEMTKHAINAFLATSVCFTNEIAMICEQVGANAKEVERGLKTEERIGPQAYLSPGSAFSGGTLARDILFLSESGRRQNLPLHLIRAVKESNDFHKGWIQRKCLTIFGDLTAKQVAILGLSYKPNTDALRRSFSMELCHWLNEKGAKIKIFDPGIDAFPKDLKKIVTVKRSLHEAIRGSDCIIIATQLQSLLQLDKATINEFIGKVVIDPNGFIEKQLTGHKDINYIVVGRRSL